MNAAHEMQTNGIHELIPFKILDGEGKTVCCQDGGIMACLELQLHDAEMRSEDEYAAVIAEMRREFGELFSRGQGWSLYFDAQRRQISEYATAEQSEFSHQGMPLWIDAERAEQFAEEPRYITRFFVTIKRRSLRLTKKTDAILKFIGNASADSGDEEAHHRERTEFESAIDLLAQGIATVVPSVVRLHGGDLISYLHSTVCTMGAQDIRFEDVGQPILFLDSWIDNCSFIADLECPKIAHAGKIFHLGFVSIRSWPTEISSDIGHVINTLPFPSRYWVRFTTVPAEQFSISVKYRQSLLAAAAHPIVRSANAEVTGETLDTEAVSRSYDAREAEIANRRGEPFGNLCVQFAVWDDDRDKLDEKLASLEETCRRLGYIAKRETFNGNNAYVGAIPGNDEQNLRHEICTLENAIFAAPWTGHWAGIERNMCVPGGGPPLFYAVSAGNTPFRFATHFDESGGGTDTVGHTMVVGQTGGGKSVLLIFAALQFAKYGGRIIYFDKRCSAKVATLAAGGKFYDFGAPDSSIGVRPLRNLDSPDAITQADIWMRRLLQDKNANINETDITDIPLTLKLMATNKPEHRTLAVFRALVQSKAVKLALNDYVSGSFRGFFDSGDEIDSGDAWWTTYEIGNVLRNREISRPLLRYLFNHMIERFDERPTMIVIDEAYDFLSDDFFAEKFGEMLRQYRKMNAFVLMATQSLADLMGHKTVSDSITNNILTRIFLPSPEISKKDVQQYYKMLGLTEKNLSVLASARPRRDYFFHTPAGTKLASLDLRSLALSVCAASSNKDQAAANQIIRDTGGLDLPRWFRHKQLPQTWIEALQTTEKN